MGSGFTGGPPWRVRPSVCVELVKDATILGDGEGEARICLQVLSPPPPAPRLLSPRGQARMRGCGPQEVRSGRWPLSVVSDGDCSPCHWPPDDGALTKRARCQHSGVSECCGVSASDRRARPSSEKPACGLGATRLSRAPRLTGPRCRLGSLGLVGGPPGQTLPMSSDCLLARKGQGPGLVSWLSHGTQH